MEHFGVIFTAALLLFSFCFLLCLLCALGLSQSRPTFLLGSKPTVFKLALTGRSFLPRERFFGAGQGEDMAAASSCVLACVWQLERKEEGESQLDFLAHGL